ncbi:nuclear transport factor 2 family protein [Amycolatopsis sp. cmx-4-68]|uniref:nuclear transport factor 2 family protein n=1 Tax=Amycolatopsis sp. cmx-4-68 TaxID=2790938 RepID=UPI003979BD06
MSRDIAVIFAAIDALDAERFATHFTPDAVFRFGNADPVVGRPAIVEAVNGFFGQVGGLTHHILDTHEVGDVVVVQIDVEYLRKDGERVIVPNADILTFDGDLVADWRIYIDVTPVFA